MLIFQVYVFRAITLGYLILFFRAIFEEEQQKKEARQKEAQKPPQHIQPQDKADH
jgi:hypothetical protein